MFSLNQARKYFPEETGLSDKKLEQLVQNLENVVDMLLDDYLLLNEADKISYNKNE